MCSISDLIPETYTVKETSGLTGYDTPPDQTVTVGPGATLSLTFTNHRQFQVIVIVCRLSDNPLYASSVTVDGSTKTSLGSGGGGSVADSVLCGLGGATFGPKHTDTYSAAVSIPQ